MGTSEVIDFERLLAPIAQDRPTGTDPREDLAPNSPYRTLKDARVQARAAERELLKEGPEAAGSAPSWQGIIDSAQAILAENAKDMEVVAWMIEGLVREQGFAGLRDGFRLARELAEKYWDNLHPMPDEDGMRRRVAGLAGLNGEEGEGTLIFPINNLPLTDGQNAGPFSRATYQQSAELEQITDPERRQKRIERGAVPLDNFMQAVKQTSAEFYRELQADLQGAREEFERLCTVLEAKCGNDADGQPLSPPSSDIRKALDACMEVIQTIAKDKLETAAPADSAAGAEGSSAPASAGVASGDGRASIASGNIRTREDAFREILRIAHFFRQTEPQSLVWYALEQVVRWGKMPLPDLLSEFVPDEGRTRFAWLGIKPAKTEGEAEAPGT